MDASVISGCSIHGGKQMAAQKLVIPCELSVTTATDGQQPFIRLEVLGETVFEEYESSLRADAKSVAGEILIAHARLLKKYGEKLIN